MLLNQLVEINEKGSIASSVNFGMMDNSETQFYLYAKVLSLTTTQQNLSCQQLVF